MKHYISISKHPGKQGKYFYTEFFKLHCIDADYTPYGVTEESFSDFFNKATSQYDGISISMPYKSIVLNYLDHIDQNASTYNLCNTVVICDGKTLGYNADFAGIEQVSTHITKEDTVSIYGNGAIGKMFYQYLKDRVNSIKIYSRSLGNWDERNTDSNIIINSTALGTINEDSPVSQLGNSVRMVIDMSIKPGKLKNQSEHVYYYSGQEFYKYQFMKQYKLYTGIEVDPIDYERIKNNYN